jgi:arginase family enzyme
MKDISIYFEPTDFEFFDGSEKRIGSSIETYRNDFPDLTPNSLALVFVPEYRNMNGALFSLDLPDRIRETFYSLFPKKQWTKKIFDLGTLLPGQETQDTFFALQQVVEELIKNEVFPVIIGGSQDLTLAQFDAYKNLEQLVNLVSIDSMPDFGETDETILPNNYLQHLLHRKPNHLFNYSVIGLQHYLVNPNEVDLIDKLFFDIMRLGEVNAKIENAEPIIRNADLLSLDFLAIRNSDFQRTEFCSPNGLYAEQVCQLARYAGLSDKLTSMGIYNFFDLDQNESNFQLLAQVIWHFIDGANNKFDDFPKANKATYQKFRVLIADMKEEITFYKSPKSERWWIEIPYHINPSSKYERHVLVPCSYADYLVAQEDEVPNLWWKTYQKILV